MIDYILWIPILLYLEQAGVILSIKSAGGCALIRPKEWMDLPLLKFSLPILEWLVFSARATTWRGLIQLMDLSIHTVCRNVHPGLNILHCSCASLGFASEILDKISGLRGLFKRIGHNSSNEHPIWFQVYSYFSVHSYQVIASLWTIFRPLPVCSIIFASQIKIINTVFLGIIPVYTIKHVNYVWMRPEDSNLRIKFLIGQGN